LNRATKGWQIQASGSRLTGSRHNLVEILNKSPRHIYLIIGDLSGFLEYAIAKDFEHLDAKNEGRVSRSGCSLEAQKAGLQRKDMAHDWGCP
jgi:hypothetical protein